MTVSRWPVGEFITGNPLERVVCEVCGSHEVTFKAHYKPNTGEITWAADDACDVWCYMCDNWGLGAIEESKYKKEEKQTEDLIKATITEKEGGRCIGHLHGAYCRAFSSIHSGLEDMEEEDVDLVRIFYKDGTQYEGGILGAYDHNDAHNAEKAPSTKEKPMRKPEKVKEPEIPRILQMDKDRYTVVSQWNTFETETLYSALMRLSNLGYEGRFVYYLPFDFGDTFPAKDFEELKAQCNPPKDIQVVRAAKRLHHEDGVIEVDTDNYKVSRGDGNEAKGAYVQAWVWVDDEEAREESEYGSK